MKNIILFLSFIIYASIIFFISNSLLLWIILVINILAMLIFKVKIKGALQNLLKIIPFILFTVVVNCILDSYEYAFFIGIKLLFVCNITYIYSKTTTVRGIAHTVKTLCKPLKIIKVNPKEIELMVCISLSMLPILKEQCIGLKDACLAKGIKFNTKNMKIILSKLMVSIMKRVNDIEEAIIEKGYGEM